MASQAGSTWAASTTCSTGGRAGRSPCSTTHCKIDKRRRLYTFFLTRLLTFSSSLVTPSPFIRMLQEQLYSSREFILSCMKLIVASLDSSVLLRLEFSKVEAFSMASMLVSLAGRFSRAEI